MRRYNVVMTRIRSEMVDIVRDFIEAHGLMTSMTLRHAEGVLGFGDVEQFVGDDASSILFRLKESCHSIFRSSGSEEPADVGAGALLDLVVGSLFHEAMALRENLYQLESYGARVEALRGVGTSATLGLLQEFEKIHRASSERLDDSVIQIDALLVQARRQFLLLLIEHKSQGLLARCVWENAEKFSSAFGQSFIEILNEIYGDPGVALLLAADSYLDSAYYSDGLRVLDDARERVTLGDGVQERIDYARGMRSFMDRDYRACIDELSQWWTVNSSEHDPGRVQFALDAVAHIKSVLADEASISIDPSEVEDLWARLNAYMDGLS